MTSFLKLFQSEKPLIGMVHLLPLPGSPRYDGDPAAVEQRAIEDARALAAAGFDGLIVENYGDAPFLPGLVGPETCAVMTSLVLSVVTTTRLPIGVNVLRNDARTALAVANATGARFIRVNVHTGATATDQGVIEGKAHQTLRERRRLRADVAILADILVKHGRPIGTGDPALAAKDAVGRGLADALVVTGHATGADADPNLLKAATDAVPGTPVLLGSGLKIENVATLAPLAAGAIVGTSVKVDGITTNPVDPERAERLARAWREAAVE
jgi:uncharacterized protein